MATAEEQAEADYMEALEAFDEGDREAALVAARKVVERISHHSDAWWLIAQLELPPNGKGDLPQVARSLAACRKVIAVDPDHREAWMLGGRMLTNDLGMLEDALEWWQQRREADPTDPEPLIEQTSLLADLGLYDKARGQLARILGEGVDSLSPAQVPRLERLHRLIQRAEAMEQGKAFTPWRKDHPAWGSIQARADKAPVRDSNRFLVFAIPLLILELYLFDPLLPEGFVGWMAMAALVGATVVGTMTYARRSAQAANIPAYHLLRAMDTETSSGRLCIPADLRDRRLYQTLSHQRSAACRVRHDAIVEAGEELPKGWKPRLPDLASADDLLAELVALAEASGDAGGDDEDGPRVLAGLDEEA